MEYTDIDLRQATKRYEASIRSKILNTSLLLFYCQISTKNTIFSEELYRKTDQGRYQV